MRIEMSEIFDPALGILYDSVIYLQRHFSGMFHAAGSSITPDTFRLPDEAFVQNWFSQMQVKIKQHLEAMEGTVKHIRAMGVTKQINQIEEARRGELGLRGREYPMVNAPFSTRMYSYAFYFSRSFGTSL